MTADTSIECPKCSEEALLTCDINNNKDIISCNSCGYYEEVSIKI